MDRKARAALRAFMSARSLQMRTYSQYQDRELPEDFYQSLTKRNQQRMAQALVVLYKKFGIRESNVLVEAQIAEWKKSGAWRKDVRRKPDPEIAELKERFEALRQDKSKSWPETADGLNQAMDMLQNYMKKLENKLVAHESGADS